MEKKLTHHLALAETSSVVAHDLCAQLHVMKFCLEELSAKNRLSKKLHEEYIAQLASSAEYMDHLLNNYRSLLKLECDPGDTFVIGSLLNYAQYVTKSHYHGMSHYFHFDKDISSLDHEYRGSCLMFAHVIFAIYAGFVECEHCRCQRDQYQFSHELEVTDNGRHQLSLILHEAQVSEDDFIQFIKARTKLKGRLRQWYGLDFLHEELEKKSNFFKVDMTNSDTAVKILLPERVEC